MTPAGPCMTRRRYSEPSCLNTSKPTAASRPARAALRMSTGVRGRRAIIQVNISHATRTDASSDSGRSSVGKPGTDGSASAVRPSVSRIATNADTRASRSEPFRDNQPAESSVMPHIADSASRRFDIQLSPAHSAVTSPMTPTEAREAIAASIRLSTWPAKSPETADLTRESRAASRSGRPASTNPTTAKPTISSGNNAKTEKYVIAAA